jgi:hypothetical protein
MLETAGIVIAPASSSTSVLSSSPSRVGHAPTSDTNDAEIARWQRKVVYEIEHEVRAHALVGRV